MSKMYFLPFRPAFDSAGVTVPGSQHYFTLVGSDTRSAPFADEALTIPLSNPVIANGIGYLPAIYLDDGVSYRVRIYDRDAEVGVDTPLEEYDPYVPALAYSDVLAALADAGGSDLVEYGGSTVKAKLDNIYGKNYGTAQSGATIPVDGVFYVNAASSNDTQWYHHGIRVHGQGGNKFNFLRAMYVGSILETTGGVITDRLDGIHAFCWVGAGAKAAEGQVYLGHVVVEAGAFITNRFNVVRVDDSNIDATADVADLGGISIGQVATAQVDRFFAIEIEDQTAATATVALNLLLSAGTGKWNIFVAGTANNAILGDLSLGKTAPPTAKLDVAGTILGSSEIISSGGRLGYTTGAGGQIAQVTSRTTAVTINKVCGDITLVSAAGSATYQKVTVSNSLVAANDTIRLCQKSGTDLYETHVVRVASGAFDFIFRTTGGTTTETPVFNFAVFKGTNN